jgi:hypothetical protein
LLKVAAHFPFAFSPSSTNRRIEATEYPTTTPLYALIPDWKLRRIFWQAGRDLSDEFAVPVIPQTGLNGGAAVSAELVEA